MYKDANIDFLNFAGEPSFNRNGTLYIYAKEDSYLYEVTADGARSWMPSGTRITRLGS